MSDDATAFDCVVVSENLLPDFVQTEEGTADFWSPFRRLEIRSEDINANGVVQISVPASDLPTARVGDKVQVAIFLRPSE